MNQTISTIPYGMSLDLKKRSVEAATFLVKNQSCILGRDGSEYLKSSIKMTVSTPITDIYVKAADLGKLNCFTMFDLSRASDIPTILTSRELAIDGKYISNNIPQDLRNIWVNLTPILRKTDAYNGNLQITDTVQLASLIARGLLCMSYNDSTQWLTPSLRKNIVEAYSLMYTMRLKVMFDLNIEEYALVRLLFAAYMAQMLDESCQRLEVPPMLYDCKFLYQDTNNPRTIDDRFEGISDVRARVAPSMKLDINAICSILQEKGPDRMKKLLKPISFYQYMSRSPNDSQSMLIATDYPPYWVHMLLENLRGGKNPFFQALIRFGGGDMKKMLVKFADELVSSRLFIEKVSR